MPMETPQAISARFPPSSCHKGICLIWASASQSALGHAMSAHALKQSRRITGSLNGLSQKGRPQVMLNGIPGCVYGFFAVERIFTGNTFTPAFRAVSAQSQQQDAALRGAPEAGFKKMHQRHTNLAQRDGLYFHLPISFGFKRCFNYQRLGCC